jgi:hypothetical protein
VSKSITATVRVTFRDRLIGALADIPEREMLCTRDPGLERDQAATVLLRSLVTLGCRTARADSDAVTGIFAERGHQLLAAQVDDGGQVTLDVAGCLDGACQPLVRELETVLATHGAVLEEQRAVEHGDVEGGALIQRAARAAGPDGNIAEGIVRAARPRRRFSGVAEPSAVPQRQRTA